jgi:hypothetical protein
MYTIEAHPRQNERPTRTEELVKKVFGSELRRERIDTLVGCLRRLHRTFGADSELFDCLEQDLLYDQPREIRLEVESRFYQTVTTEADPPCPPQGLNLAWSLD